MNKTLLNKTRTIGRIATLAIALLALSSTAFADNDRRRGGYNHGNQRWNNHSANRNWNRHDRNRNSSFDGGSFFGGVVLGSILGSNYSRPSYSHASYSHASVYYEDPWRSHRYSRPLRSSYGYFNSSYYEPYRVTRPRSTVVYSTVVKPAPIVITAPQISVTHTRRLLLDLEGRCFDVTIDEQGVERRLQLEDEACAF